MVIPGYGVNIPGFGNIITQSGNGLFFSVLLCLPPLPLAGFSRLQRVYLQPVADVGIDRQLLVVADGGTGQHVASHQPLDHIVAMGFADSGQLGELRQRDPVRRLLVAEGLADHRQQNAVLTARQPVLCLHQFLEQVIRKAGVPVLHACLLPACAGIGVGLRLGRRKLVNRAH